MTKTTKKHAYGYAGIAAAAAVALLAGTVGSATADHDPNSSYSATCEAVQDLRVAQENRAGYDRDKFGDYDRDALLAASEKKHGDNYYSVFDNVHYYFKDYDSKEHADDEVDVDHAVALAEAWDSGAGDWPQEKRDRFGGDTTNLTLLTSSENRYDKSDKDVTEWLPPYDGAVGRYVTMWVEVKTEYGLSVDPAERDRLLELTSCEAGTTPPADDGGGSGDDKGDGGDNGGDGGHRDKGNGNGKGQGGNAPEKPTDTNKTPATDADDDTDDVPTAGPPTPVTATLPVTG